VEKIVSSLHIAVNHGRKTDKYRSGVGTCVNHIEVEILSKIIHFNFKYIFSIFIK